MTAAWRGVAQPSLRPSDCGWHPHLTERQHPTGQTGRRLRTGSGKWVSMSSPAVPHPVPCSTSAGGSELIDFPNVELGRRLRWLEALHPNYDDEEEEDDQNGEDDMEAEDSETPSLEYRTINDRAGGRQQAECDRQQTGDAELASAAIRDGGPNAGQERVPAMKQRRTTGESNMGNRGQDQDWGANISERRRQATPRGGVNVFHSKVPSSQLGLFQIP